MTETFKQATRISGITAPITIVGEEDEQSFTGGTAVKVSSSVSVDDDDNGDLIRNHRSDASSNSSSSSSSSSSGVDSQLDSDDEESYNSESTRSCTFSIYCLMHEDGAFEDGSTGDDDCSSISTVSNFVREKEDEEAYYNNLDDSFTYASCSDSDDDDEDSENDCDVVEVLKSQTEKSKAAAKDGERAVFDDENVSKDNSDFTSDDDDNDDDDDDDDYYDESYDEDLDEDEDKEGDQELYDDEYGDEYGDDQEEVVEELLEESDRSQLSHSSSGPASDIVFEKNKRIFSNANSRQSHSNQMALFLKNIAETKAAVGIVDDEEPEIEVIEEEVVDEEEDETEVEYVDETEVDEDDEEDFVYEVLLSPKAKNKETRRNRLSFLSV